MFGKVIEIVKNHIKMINTTNVSQPGVMGYHVIFDEEDRKVVAEITACDDKYFEANLVGEIINNFFTSGVLRRPSFLSLARIVTKSELELLMGKQDYKSPDTLLIGNSVTYKDYKVTCNINELFSQHFAVLGNTGAGKSCCVARLIQNILYENNEAFPLNAHLILFDAFGEYNSAFANISNIPGMNFKYYTTDVNTPNNNLVRIPAYFLEVDDLALLLGASDSQQLPVIEKALQLVYIFKSENAVQYKSDIIAKSLLDILSSGKLAQQIRDQIIAVLTTFNTPQINLDTPIVQPGYTRTLRQCLNIDNQGKIAAMSLVVDKLSEFNKTDLDDIEVVHDFVYTLEDLYQAFEFALISEGVLSSSKAFDIANTLKVRLHGIINSEKKEYFNVKEYMTKDEFMINYFTAFDDHRKVCQIINMNFAYVDDRFAKVLTKIYSKLFFNFSTSLKLRASFPIHIILEEAHRYVQNDSDIDVIGYNIFDRITKEGRKYGVLLGFITQRPSELSTTALSQCSNFITLRMYHPDDLKIIGAITSNLTSDNLEQIKTLRPGMAMAFGTAFRLPFICTMDLPNPMPESTSVDVKSRWFGQ